MYGKGPRTPPARDAGMWVRTRTELKAQRRRRPHRCWNHLLAAPLWPKYGVNLGTLLRTCDAVGACLVVPRTPWIDEALDRGNTMRQPILRPPGGPAAGLAGPTAGRRNGGWARRCANSAA